MIHVFRQPREKLVIASKVRFRWDPSNPNGLGLSRGRILQAINDSLKRLQTDYIDLYQVCFIILISLQIYNLGVLFKKIVACIRVSVVKENTEKTFLTFFMVC